MEFYIHAFTYYPTTFFSKQYMKLDRTRCILSIRNLPNNINFTGNYSCLKVDLIFTRDRAFYFTTVFIPGIILVTSSFITFWLEWNAVPARSMIGKICGWRMGMFSVLHPYLFLSECRRGWGCP